MSGPAGSGRVRVRVPATAANLGPGFDTFGLALGVYDDVEIAMVDAGVRVEVTGEGADELPGDERHLVVRALQATLAELGEPPAGLRLRCVNRIPQGRGLGSSAAAICAGVLGARALVPDGAARLDDAGVLALAARLEGHPDNVAACLLGGLTLAWTEATGHAQAVRLEPAPALTPVVLVPAGVASTAQVRGLLPATVPHVDAAANAARAALCVVALTARPDLLHAATEDRLHQAYRAPAMPATAAMVARLRADGVPAVVSGAGPSVLCLLTGSAQVPAYAGDGWRVLHSGVAAAGARVAGTPEARP